MHALTPLETGFLAGGLVLCLVLPLLMSFRGPLDRGTKTACMRIVWTGQTLLLLAGITVLASSFVAPFAALLGLMGYIACIIALLHQFSRARSA